MHRLNYQVKMFNCKFKHVVGIQAHGGDSGLSDLLKSLLSFERGTESWSRLWGSRGEGNNQLLFILLFRDAPGVSADLLSVI